MISISDWFKKHINQSILHTTVLLVVLGSSFILIYHFKSKTDLQNEIDISRQILQGALQTQNRPLAELTLNQIHLLTKSDKTILCHGLKTILAINSGFESCLEVDDSAGQLSLPNNSGYKILVHSDRFSVDSLWVITVLIVAILVGFIYLNLRRLHSAVRTDLLEPTLSQDTSSPIREIMEYRMQLAEIEKMKTENAVAEATIGIAKQIAHDIRSPLMALNMLRANSNLNEQSQKEIIQSAIDRINGMAEDLLHKAKTAETSHENYQASLVKNDIASKIKRLVEEKRAEHRTHKIDFTVKLPRDLLFPSDFSGSGLLRVLSNLLNNSVESGASEIKIEVKTSNNGRIHLFVNDNGGGMDEVTVAKVTTSGFTTKLKGNGLGLSGAKSWVEGIGGNFQIISKQNVGTQVQLSL